MLVLRVTVFLVSTIALVNCSTPALLRAADRQPPHADQKSSVHSVDEIQLLRFLQGRWSGRAPDGSTFYEEYDFPSPTTLRSRRFADATFGQSSDGSTVTLEEGEIVSRWGEFTWRASEVSDGFVAFEPLNAPSRFSWRRISADRVDVVQNWTDESGVAQSYIVQLSRIAGH